MNKILVKLVSLSAALLIDKAAAQAPLMTQVREGTVVAVLHAEGAQFYECKADAGKSPSEAGALTWQFREPIATLLVDGKSVGRHYAGPTWEHVDGSLVKGKTVASGPGATKDDIAVLELEVVERRGNGLLSDATSVQRINTKGGVAKGNCERAGSYLSVPYSADYVFQRKAGAADLKSPQASNR
jgi:hypothetical protein